MRTHTPQIRRKHHNIVLEIPNASLFLPSFLPFLCVLFQHFRVFLPTYFRFFFTLKTFSSFSSLSISLASRETFPNIFYIVFHYSLFLFFLCWHTNFVSFFRPTPIVNMLLPLSLPLIKMFTLYSRYPSLLRLSVSSGREKDDSCRFCLFSLFIQSLDFYRLPLLPSVNYSLHYYYFIHS